MIPLGADEENPGTERRAFTTSEQEALVEDEHGIAFSLGVDPQRTGTAVFLGRAVAGPGTRIPPHTHSADTVAYLAAGRAVFRCGDDLQEVHHLSAGDWLFVPAGQVHSEETPEDSEADFLYARDAQGGSTTYREPPA